MKNLNEKKLNEIAITSAVLGIPSAILLRIVDLFGTLTGIYGIWMALVVLVEYMALIAGLFGGVVALYFLMVRRCSNINR